LQIIFVCSGNTCRSPLALCAWQLATREICKRHASASLIFSRIKAHSAGLCASPGATATRFARLVAKEWGTDLENHRAAMFRPVQADSELIIAMTGDQAAIVRAHFSPREDQVRLLSSYAPRHEKIAEAARFGPMWGDASDVWSTQGDEEPDILDPYGESLEAYQACGEQIRRCVSELARTLAKIDTKPEA
jgi:protein-tyrosine-phosphatase